MPGRLGTRLIALQLLTIMSVSLTTGCIPEVCVPIAQNGNCAGSTRNNPPAAIGLTATSLTFNAAQGGGNPPVQTVTITNTGGVTLSNIVVGTIAYGGSASGWLQTGLSSNSTANANPVLTVTAVTGTLTQGRYSATIPVESAIAVNTPQNIAVTLDVGPPACTTIEDQFGADAGWTTAVTTSGVSPAQSVTFQPTGGMLGSGYRQMQHTFTGIGAISVFHYYGTTTYNPSAQGAIDHINYYEDQIELNPPTPGAAVGTGFSLMQGGTRYNVVLRPPSGAFSNTIWETTSRLNLTAADFPGVNFATGGPITFGYFRSNSNTGGGSYTITHGIDNWKVEVCR